MGWRYMRQYHLLYYARELSAIKEPLRLISTAAKPHMITSKGSHMHMRWRKLALVRDTLSRLVFMCSQ